MKILNFNNLLRLLVFLVIISVSGCASSLRNHALEFVGSYTEQVLKHVKSRKAQLDVRLGFLNDDLLAYKYDPVKSAKIKKMIDLLHDEQRFLYTLDIAQFKLEYEIVDEKQVNENLREIIVKVSGKTIKLDKAGISEIVEIPEDASFWLFKEFIKTGKSHIIGPLPLTSDRIKKYQKKHEKTPEN